MWDGVPWFMGHGAVHGEEIARVLAYTAAQGGEGVVGTTDCRVLASSIPDGNIHIAQGAVAMLNRFPGGGQQAYLVRNEGDEVKALPAQGSSGVRYDLVAVVVEDPDYAGQPSPPSATTGPYVRTRVYSNVPSTTLTLQDVDDDSSGYALALVKFDASDGTITQSDIIDLRELVLPRTKTVLRTYEVPNDGSSGYANPNSVYGPFPAQAIFAGITIPPWATTCVIEATWSNVLVESAAGQGTTVLSGNGAQRVKLGTLYTTRGLWTHSMVSGQQMSTVMFNSDLLSIPTVMRGTKQTAQVEAYNTGAGTGNVTRIKWDFRTTVLLKITFFEAPEAN